jgi:anti-sigma regulatory factor (Ser/Thr protein kinase)
MSAPFHLAFEMNESSQVGAARRASVQIAEGLGYDAVATGQVALVATELGNNLVRHARGGQLVVAAVCADGGEWGVEVDSIDSGPGMADVAASLADGHSTGGTPGNGLGAVRRLSDASFDMYSAPSEGTAIVTRIRAGAAVQAASRAAFEYGAIALPMAGEAVCGDAWCVVQEGGRAAVLVADGLGHGPDAAEASAAAVEAFRPLAFDAPAAVLERIHQRLRSTRGAAVAIAQLSATDDSVLFCGAGNVAGRLFNGVVDRTLLSQHGTAGLRMRSLQAQRYEWPAHGLLVLHSDGLKSRWTVQAAPRLLQHHPAVLAAWLCREQHRGRDDATVVAIRRRAG